METIRECAHPKQCSKCGCTDGKACDGGCFWVLRILCSRCAIESFLAAAMHLNPVNRAIAARELADAAVRLLVSMREQTAEGRKPKGQKPEGQKPEGQKPEGQKPEGPQSLAPGTGSTVPVPRRRRPQPHIAADACSDLFEPLQRL